jgi:alginate O-acetyltransferase complex protein AlgI
MPFNSFVFVLFFFAVVMIHSLPLPRILRKLNLLVASYLFYAAWEPWFVTLLVYSTAVNWIAGKLFEAWDHQQRRRKRVLWLAVVLNLGMLAAFKYGNEFLSLSQMTASKLGVPYAPPSLKILLPVGLSFFTFQSLSYTIDVYRKTIKPATSFLDFALFVSFFPVLLAGPLLRADQFLPQCAQTRRATGAEFGWGMALFTLGLFMKVTLADHLLAPISSQVFDPEVRPDTLSAWTGTFAFAGQDYCDFAGYSTCAMGIGYCLGFALPPNFHAPFASVGFRDVWQRWHITLVAWMRDYVFNPLGGVYKGYFRASVNVTLVMLLIAFWHGASVTFLIFGLLHASYLIAEIFLQRTHLRRLRFWVGPIGSFVLWGLTLILCAVGFVFYRAHSMQQSVWMLQAMCGRPHLSYSSSLSHTDIIITLFVLEGLVLSHWRLRRTTLESTVRHTPSLVVSIALASMMVAIALSFGHSEPYLYFNF